jgi:regulator of protease activity HflC (stomatin/prohibitin superfamily)
VAGGLVAALAVVYFIFSLGTRQLDEVAALLRFGKPIADLEKGLYFAPLGIYEIRKEAGTIFEDELPADPEKIYHEDGPIPEGMFRPILVKFGQPREDDDGALKKDPYNVAMVAKVVPVVRWQITRPIVFFGTIGNVANCRKSMEDLAVSLFGIEFAHETPALASRRLEDISVELLRQISEVAVGWGIDVNGVNIKPFQFSHALNTAVVGVSAAQQNALARVHEAHGAADAEVVAAVAEQKRLLTTGLAVTRGSKTITGADGKEYKYEEIELVPDATTKANADALTALKELKGTLVLNGGASTVLDVSKKGGEQ